MFVNDYLDVFFNVVVDVGIVLLVFIMVVEVCGFGCCLVSVVCNYVDEVS